MPRPRNHTMEWARLKTTDDTLSDARSTQKAVEFIQRSAREAKPFFLGLGFRMPHSPYAAPSRYFDLYDAGQIPAPEVSQEHIRSLPAAAWYELADQARPDRDQAKKYIAAYYACVSFMDAQVGRVLAAMDLVESVDEVPAGQRLFSTRTAYQRRCARPAARAAGKSSTCVLRCSKNSRAAPTGSAAGSWRCS